MDNPTEDEEKVFLRAQVESLQAKLYKEQTLLQEKYVEYEGLLIDIINKHKMAMESQHDAHTYMLACNKSLSIFKDNQLEELRHNNKEKDILIKSLEKEVGESKKHEACLRRELSRKTVLQPIQIPENNTIDQQENHAIDQEKNHMKPPQYGDSPGTGFGPIKPPLQLIRQTSCPQPVKMIDANSVEPV